MKYLYYLAITEMRLLLLGDQIEMKKVSFLTPNFYLTVLHS